MSDVQLLYLVLCLLYLSDCFCWVRRQSLAFVSPWWRCWRVAMGSALFGNDRGGLLLLNPLPPLGRVFLAHLSPISLSPAGVCAANRQSLPGAVRPRQSGNAIAFERIERAAADGLLLKINGARFAGCGSARQAAGLAATINAVVALPAAEREAAISAHLAGQFAREKAAETLEQARSLTRPLSWWCLIFFVGLFVVAPILVIIFGLAYVIVPIVIFLYAFAVQIAILFHEAHKKLYGAEKQDRLTDVVKMILFPPAAIRAADRLNAEALSPFNPLVTAALLSPQDTAAFVESWLRDLAHPLRQELNDPPAVAIAAWYAARQLEQALAFVKRHDPPRAEAFSAAPEPAGASATYCPRCGEQFALEAGECPDCPGVELVPFTRSGTAEKKEKP